MTYAIGLDREIGSIRVGLEARYAKTGVGGEGRGVAIVYYDVLSLIELAPLISFRVARFGQGLALRLEAGPIIDIWRFENEEPRNRVGGRAGLSVEWPLLRQLSGSLRVAEALSSTVFEEHEFESETVELRPVWRTSVALAMRYRF
jgi:hypothetical protein